MQHSSLVLFCEECGLANELVAGYCTGCGQPLVQADDTPRRLPAAPVTITSPTVLEVTPGSLAMPFSLDANGQISQFPACDFRPGSIFAERYEIGEEVGRGGFSTVYHAVDQEFGYHYREVAIKRIELTQLTPRQIIDATETFNREIAMLARLHGTDGIPAYYTHLTDAENWYLITQYIKGQTLEEYVQKAPGGYLAEKEVLTIGITLAKLLQRLHRMSPPVIFRDLKPSNIIFTPDQTFFLIDFGIARTFTPGKARDTTPLGSPGYAPPEQYGKAQTTPHSDIYALGATLQTLLTGRDPLDLRSGQPALSSQPPSRALRTLLDAMLSADATKRPATMARVARRLEYIVHRPLVIFLSGLLLLFIISMFFLFITLLSWGNNVLIWLSPIPLIAAAAAQFFINKKLQAPKEIPDGFKRFYLLGLLSGSLPLLGLFIFIHWSF